MGSIKGVTQKNGYWYARIDGKQVYCGKGSKAKQLAEAARQKWNVKQYENKQVNAGLKVKKIRFKNFAELCNWYMTLPSIQNQKIYERKIHATAHLLAYFKDNPLNRMENTQQEQYRLYRENEGAAPGTIDLELKLLRTMYYKAIKGKLIPANYMPGEFVVKNIIIPRRIITDEEFGLMLNNAKPDFQDVLICAWETGMRSSEICNLTVGNVKLDIPHISGDTLDYIDLGIFETKTGARRMIPITDSLENVIKSRIIGLKEDDYVFTNEKGLKFYPQTIKSRFESVCGRAGIIYGDKPVNAKGERIGVVFHCFRHTRTTKWVEMGFSDEIVRRATGHKTLEAYQNYIKLDAHAVMPLEKNNQRENGIKTR